MLRVFIDNCVVRNSQQVRIELEEVQENINWGGQEFTVPITKPKAVYPNEKFKNQNDLRAYVDSQKIPRIEKLARLKLIKLYWHHELRWEFISKRKLKKGNVSIVNYIHEANSPIYYSRVVASAISKEDYQFNFIKNLKHQRFNEWKNACGVIAGSKKERNQTLDAFHLWTAEHNWCDYFVTMDYKLISAVEKSTLKTELNIVSPTELLKIAYCYIPIVLLERLCKRILNHKNR